MVVIRLKVLVLGNVPTCHGSCLPGGPNISPTPAQKNNHALKITPIAVRVSIYSEWCHHPPCLLACYLPAAVSQTYRSSGWEAAELRRFISSVKAALARCVPQSGWHSCLALILTLNVFSFTSRFYFYGNQPSFILKTGCVHTAAS